MARLLPVLVLTSLAVTAQTTRYNYDEKKIPPYTVPDPLLLANGDKVTDAKTWTEKRRPELLAIFADQVYGKTPAAPPTLRTSEVVTDRKALNGKAIRKQVTIYFTPDDAGPQMHLLLYLPASSKTPSPVFLGLNFNGNHTVNADPGILATDVWVKDPTSITNAANAKNAPIAP